MSYYPDCRLCVTMYYTNICRNSVHSHSLDQLIIVLLLCTGLSSCTPNSKIIVLEPLVYL